jgi:hypothetical protein
MLIVVDMIAIIIQTLHREWRWWWNAIRIRICIDLHCIVIIIIIVMVIARINAIACVTDICQILVIVVIVIMIMIITVVAVIAIIAIVVALFLALECIRQHMRLRFV